MKVVAASLFWMTAELSGLNSIDAGALFDLLILLINS